MATTSEAGAGSPVSAGDAVGAGIPVGAGVHVALLRGINVGGNNLLPMASLRALLADLGLGAVRTYLNSGNALFTCAPIDHMLLAERIEGAIEAAAGFRPRVLVRSGEDIRAIAELIPAEWTQDQEMRTDVLYLLDGVPPEEVVRDLAPRPGIEHVRLGVGAVIWMVARRDATRSRLQGITATAHYPRVTIRNVNTARRLAALAAEMADG